MDEKDDILGKTGLLLEIVNTPWRNFYLLTFMHLKSNYSESMNGPAERWEKRLL